MTTDSSTDVLRNLKQYASGCNDEKSEDFSEDSDDGDDDIEVIVSKGDEIKCDDKLHFKNDKYSLPEKISHSFQKRKKHKKEKKKRKKEKRNRPKEKFGHKR